MKKNPDQTTTQVKVCGMHCKSCELLIESELKQIHGVHQIQVSHHSGQLSIKHHAGVGLHQIEAAIKKAGYSLGEDVEVLPWISRDKKTWTNIGLLTMLIVVLFLVASRLELTLPSWKYNQGQVGAVAALLVGLTAGFSTCMALVGGIVLGVMSRYSAAHPNISIRHKLIPLSTFLLGRTIGYFILGGLMGLFGTMIGFSPQTTAGLTILVSGVTLFLGLQLLGVFPRLAKYSVSLPTSWSRKLGLSQSSINQYSIGQTMLLGALTFFVPCGFTQSMQLVALGSGSFVGGAVVMGLFALGTAPGLFGLGGISAVIKGTKNNLFFQLIGLIVIVMALINLRGSLVVLGVNLPSFNNVVGAVAQNYLPQSENGVQIVRMTQDSHGYTPNRLTIKRSAPVRWIINSEDAYNCASSLVVPSLNISQFLKLGENVIEFQPPAQGDTLAFSCSMGMYRGQFQIID